MAQVLVTLGVAALLGLALAAVYWLQRAMRPK
jgi:hypothetical protein